MPYTPINIINGTTPVNATFGNFVQTQYTEATNSFEQDLFTAFVLSGLVCTKDGSINNQLDVTAGVAFLTQSDSTLRRRAPVSSTQTTSVINTTYYLFLNNDGTWTWGTTSTGPANSLAICQATTDASGNILVVTDKRQLNTTQFTSAGGYVYSTAAPTHMSVRGTGFNIGSAVAQPANSANVGLYLNATTGNLDMSIPAGAYWALIPVNAGTYPAPVFKVDGNGIPITVWGQATAGKGVAVIVAQSLSFAVTVTTAQTVINFSAPATGVYRVTVTFYKNNGAGNANPSVLVLYTGGNSGVGIGQALALPAGTALDGTTVVANGEYGIAPLDIYAQTGTAIKVTYQDPTGTPNDKVNAMVERLT